MKFIAKAKETNKIRTLEDIGQFSKSEFEKYELYEVRPVTPETYDAIIRKKKIDELTTQLKELGVDLNQVSKPIPQAPSNDVDIGKPTNLPEDEPVIKPEGIIKNLDKPSKVINPKTKKPFSEREIQDTFFLFKDNLERDIPDIAFMTFNERGIILSMIEARPDLPKHLPNGVPLIQVVKQQQMRM
jgi:hypothetical protein